MTSQPDVNAFALRPVFDNPHAGGRWWPQTRTLSDQLKQLFALWPEDAGRISRVLCSPPDWDDRPRSVDIEGITRPVTGPPSDEPPDWDNEARHT